MSETTEKNELLPAVVVPVASEIEQVLKGSKLSEADQLAIQKQFGPTIQKLEEWRAIAETLVVTDIKEKDKMRTARDTRLILKKARVAADGLRKQLKADHLAYCNTVQAVYNLLESKVIPIEDHLKEQEEFQLRWETKLAAERLELLEPYKGMIPDLENMKLGKMKERSFQELLTNIQNQLAEKLRKETEEMERQKLEEKNAGAAPDLFDVTELPENTTVTLANPDNGTFVVNPVEPEVELVSVGEEVHKLPVPSLSGMEEAPNADFSVAKPLDEKAFRLFNMIMEELAGAQHFIGEEVVVKKQNWETVALSVTERFFKDETAY